MAKETLILIADINVCSNEHVGLWGKTNMPSPKLRSNLPDASKWRIGGRLEPAQVLAPHRSATQMLPSGAMPTELVDPQVLPSGSLAQFSIVR